MPGLVVVSPSGSTTVTVVPGGARQPAGPGGGLSDANNLLLVSGAEVPARKNWCEEKLGPWLVWNMRFAHPYCFAMSKYGWISPFELSTNLYCGLAGITHPGAGVKISLSAPSILPLS